MNPIFAKKWDELLKDHLRDRMISLEDVSQDGYVIRGRIVSADLKGEDLVIHTVGTTIKFDGERAQPHSEEEFSALVDDIEGLAVQNDGAITFHNWSGFDTIHILPHGEEFDES